VPKFLGENNHDDRDVCWRDCSIMVSKIGRWSVRVSK
jgi:hypothetical protein